MNNYQKTFIDAMARVNKGDKVILLQRGKEKMSHHYYLNEDHTYTPCDLMTWSNQSEKLWKENKKHVADEDVNGKRVSTVWLGLDHNFLGIGSKPLLFETMVFDKPSTGQDIYMDRYTTWDEAVDGHKKAIQWVLDGCNDDTR